MATTFDAEGFRAAAKEKGWSEEFIQKQIDTHNAGLKGPATQPTQADVQTGGAYDWLAPAIGTAAAAWALGKAADSEVGQKMFSSLKDMFGSKQAGSAERIDPTFGGGQPKPGFTAEQPEYAPRKFTPTDVTDVASRPAGTDRLQLPGPTPVAEPAAPVAKVAPTGVPTPQPYQGAGLQQPQMTYGQTNLTGAVAGVPNPLGAAPPVTTAPAPVAPVAMTDKQRLEKAKADLAELKLEQAKNAVGNIQKGQGKPLTDPESILQMQSDRNKIANSIDSEVKAANKAAAAQAAPAPVTPAAPAAPAVPQSAAPAATPAAVPLAPSPEAVAVAQQAEAQKQAAQAPAPEPEAKPTPTSEVKTTEKPKRRSAEEVAASKAVKPFESAKSSLLNNLGAKDSAEMDAKARAALGVLKEEVFGGEKVKQTESHVNKEWAKAKAYILANPGKFDPEIVARQQKSGEQLRSEARLRKAAELAAAMAGGSSGGGGMAGGPRLGPGVGGLTQGAGGDISKLNPMKLMQ
jgi:hypothetical protein